MEVINNKHDGLFDDLLPYARIELNREHIISPCDGTQREVSQEAWKQLNAAFKTDDNSKQTFHATIGPGCSGGVGAVTNAEWRAENNASQVVISPGSTASILEDEVKLNGLERQAKKALVQRVSLLKQLLTVNIVHPSLRPIVVSIASLSASTEVKILVENESTRYSC